MTSVRDAYSIRRSRLMVRMNGRPVVIASGKTPSRNFPANLRQIRSSSHFLYFVGRQMDEAFLVLMGGVSQLFITRPPEGDDLWHGPTPDLATLSADTKCDVKYIDALEPSALRHAATLPVMDTTTNRQLTALLDRAEPIEPGTISTLDDELVDAIVEIRLIHDEQAIRDLRRAADATVIAHHAARSMIAPGRNEHDVWAVMQAAFTERGMHAAYPPIITTHGEILHGRVKGNPLKAGDLLLIDVGAETENGWAADVTRTWPVSGSFSTTQRQIYDIVHAAHQAAIDCVRPGIRYRDVHLVAAQTIASGLVDIGILSGCPEELVADDVHALFFPHGVGHLLGLDVHDMEDLGDRAGYPTGQARSKRFGLCYLRLDRILEVGMAITIEPGFYLVPSLLNNPEKFAQSKGRINFERLAHFTDVRGIRIEDDILVRPDGCEILTKGIPTTVHQA
ncbi:MAG: aminopeptidase P family protein [Myxococcota bacterium]|nr:aminopeptidase P family protein [Myxococcota bacterium]